MSETELLIKLGKRILARIRPSKKNKLPQASTPEIFSSVGYKLETHFFSHASSNAPTLLMCTDFPDTANSFLEERYPIPCAEIFHLGYNLLLFDPAGRGGSWGTEDYGGLEHQDNISTLLNWINQQIPQSDIGVVSFGCGLSMAIGGITAYNNDVSFLIDFEGPSDEEFLGKYYDLPKKKTDSYFWKERSPILLLESFTTRYIRFQTDKDHRSAYDMRHCNRIFRQLKKQQHPQYQLNDHPMGTYPPQPQLLVADRRVIQQKWVHVLRSLYNER